MILNLDDYSPDAIYFLMTQTLVPRPIAWVLSENENSTYNLAPFSYFNAVCSNPPLVMLSVGKKPDGSDKDTHANIRDRKHFTIHIADVSLADAVNQTSATLDAGVSELDELGLDTVDFDGHPVPRLVDSKIAYACELHDIHMLGETPQAVIYGEVMSIHIDDDIVTTNEKGRIKVHNERLQPLGRLGAGEFMAPGNIVTLQRPR